MESWFKDVWKGLKRGSLSKSSAKSKETRAGQDTDSLESKSDAGELRQPMHEEIISSH